MHLESKGKVIRNKDTGNIMERYIKSFFHAIHGIVYATIHEHNILIIILAVIVVSLAGFLFDISSYEWLFCITMFGIIFAIEMLNTAIEAVVDLVTTEYHELAKIAKDTASSASLILSITAFIGAIIIFAPKIAELFN